MSTQKIVDELSEEIPCRRQQFQLLINLFGRVEDLSVPSVFVYGHTGTGKSLVIEKLLQRCQLPHVFINCVECFLPRLLYEQVLNAAAGHQPHLDNQYTNISRCDNMNNFVHQLKQVLGENVTQTFYIVLESAERLHDSSLLPGLLRLQELTGLNVCVVLLSEIVWEKLRPGSYEPLIIHFPDYSKDELLEILCLDCNTDYPVSFYRTYLNLLLSVFYLACRNLRELRHLTKQNFAKYVEPIEQGEATMDESRKLWRNIEPYIKKSLQMLYMREVSSVQWEGMQQTTSASRTNMELPFYSKYLLIAAYVASYNPATSDRRFFTKNAGKMSKRTNQSLQKKHRTSNQLLGPKLFALDRLMAIFYSIVGSSVTPTANIFSQISSLVSLGLLAMNASHEHIDSPKYKCLVNLSFIKDIARTVNFEVLHYLYDFM